MTDLLDKPSVIRQAQAFGVPSTSIELLVAIDRSLRALNAAGVIGADARDGWVLSGPTALHGVYLRSAELLRVPEELCFGPVAGKELADQMHLVSQISAALPKSSISDVGDGLWHIEYRGATGQCILPVRFEKNPLRLAPPAQTENAVYAEPGYLYDPRLGYISRVAETPIPVAVAFVEELLLRLCVALVSTNRVDYGARVDDLRLALALEYGDTRDMLATAVRDSFIAGLRAKNVDEASIGRQLQAIVDRIARTVESFDDPNVLAAGLRPDGASYDRRDFEVVLGKALPVIVTG